VICILLDILPSEYVKWKSSANRYVSGELARGYKIDVVFVGVAIFMELSVILTLRVKQPESRLASWRPKTAKTF